MGGFRAGGAELSRAVEPILGENPANAGLIVGLAKLANPDQKAAIAVGMLHLLHHLDQASDAARIIRVALLDAIPCSAPYSQLWRCSSTAQNVYAQNGEQGGGRLGGFFGGAGGGEFSGGSGGAPPFLVNSD